MVAGWSNKIIKCKVVTGCDVQFKASFIQFTERDVTWYLNHHGGETLWPVIKVL